MEEFTAEVIRRVDGKFGWRLRHANGDIVATDGGQGYENLHDCASMAQKLSESSWSVQDSVSESG